MKKYYHELTQAEIDALIESKITYGELAKLHPQPKWCTYTDAVMGEMGCWSLMIPGKVNRDFCRKCECSKDYVKPAATAPAVARREDEEAT